MKFFCAFIVSFLPKSFLSSLFYAASQELQYRKRQELIEAIDNLLHTT